MNWFKKIMAGRYGSDQLNLVLLGVSILMSLIGQLAGFGVLILLSYIPLAATLYRMFSKNIEKRRMENYKFAMMISPLYQKYQRLKTRLKERKTYRRVKCPSCGKMLRVPRGKGKIQVTCPSCHHRFTIKS